MTLTTLRRTRIKKDFFGALMRKTTTTTTTTILLRRAEGGGGRFAFSSSRKSGDAKHSSSFKTSSSSSSSLFDDEAREGGVVQTTTMRDEEDDASPPHPAEFLLNQPLKLYRDCLRLADYLAFKQSVPRFALREQVKHVWRKNQFLTDTNEIRTAREAAVRGLSNSMMHLATENLDVENSNKRAFLDEEEDEEKEKK